MSRILVFSLFVIYCSINASEAVWPSGRVLLPVILGSGIISGWNSRIIWFECSIPGQKPAASSISSLTRSLRQLRLPVGALDY